MDEEEIWYGGNPGGRTVATYRLVTPERLAALEQAEQERDAMCQILTALRIQLKADRRQKWQHPIASIEAVLASLPGARGEAP